MSYLSDEGIKEVQDPCSDDEAPAKTTRKPRKARAPYSSSDSDGDQGESQFKAQACTKAHPTSKVCRPSKTCALCLFCRTMSPASHPST